LKIEMFQTTLSIESIVTRNFDDVVSWFRIVMQRGGRGEKKVTASLVTTKWQQSHSLLQKHSRQIAQN
jgi:hypothetical protein